jgi:glycosyltransferase involved in cell wall biosynthesis
VDVDSAKFADYGRRGGGLASRIHALEGRRLGRYEEELVRDCDRVVLCTEPECELLRGRIDDPALAARIRAIRNGAVLPEASELVGTKSEPSILFVGAMDYLANVDAVEFGAREIMPLIRERVPQAVYRIVGRNPAPRVRALDGLPGVEVLGGVDDLAPYLREARVSLVPLRIAQGIQNKILEAMAWELPVVTNRRLGPTIGAEDGAEILLAESAEDYAAATVRMLEDRGEATRLGRAGRELVAKHFAWSARYRELNELLLEACAQHAGAAGA